MLRFFAACMVLFCALISTANSSPLAVDQAIKSLDAIAVDAKKLDAYCAALKKLYAAGEDETKQAEAEESFNKVLLSFGPEFQMLLEAYDAAKPESNEEKQLDDAFLKLDSKCES